MPKFSKGEPVLITKKHPKLGWFGFKPNIKNTAGVILAEGLPEAGSKCWLVEFRHPVSHRVCTSAFAEEMLDNFDPVYDELIFFTKNWCCHLAVMHNGVQKAECAHIPPYIGAVARGFVVHPFPNWPEISIRVMEHDRSEVLARGRLVIIKQIAAP